MKPRIILKISGAALKDKHNSDILCTTKLNDLAKQIKIIHKAYDIAIVVGGGNIWRGGTSNHNYYREEQAHYMGMVATIINSVALKEVLLKQKIDTEVHSLLPCSKVAFDYNKIRANQALAKHKIVILAGGTGKPFFSTDTGASQNAIDLKVSQIFMGKDGVDGVYSADPKTNRNAMRYSQLTFKEAISKKLKVMDIAALKMCQTHKIKIVVFNLDRKNAIIDAIKNRIPTTMVSN